MILDKADNKPGRKPFKVFKTAIVAGLTSIIPLSIGMILMWAYPLPSGFKNHPLSLYLILSAFFIPTAIAMFLIAARGYRDGHFFKILFTGLISYQITLISMFTIVVLRDIFNDSFVMTLDSRGFREPFVFNYFILLLAFIFWLIPGKLPYYRKQMEP